MPLIKLYANLRTATGKKELTLPGETMQEVLANLCQEYPGLVRFLFEKEKLRPRVILTVNGQTLDPATGMDQ
ncbi:MoaD/ThiS family protein, partial [bacterium]|nr:MoaD/ThiS family protein [bacterium]